MHQKIIIAFLFSAAVNASVFTVQDPITGCAGNSYCTGFQVCGTGHCHRLKSCGTWGGKENTCCYAETSSETCEGGLDGFDFATSGVEPSNAKTCPGGTEIATYDYVKEEYACCPPGSDNIIIEVAPQNASYLGPSVPLRDKYQTITTARCIGGEISNSSSDPSTTTGASEGTMGTPTGAPSGTSSPNSANSNGVTVLLGLSFLGLVLQFA